MIPGGKGGFELAVGNCEPNHHYRYAPLIFGWRYSGARHCNLHLRARHRTLEKHKTIRILSGSEEARHGGR
jgi:hypothetical protein